MSRIEIENAILKNNVQEREISDDKYAPMIIKSIVFGLIGLILVSVMGVIIGVFEKRVDNVFTISEEDILKATVIEAD